MGSLQHIYSSMVNSDSDSEMSFEFENIDEELLLRVEDPQNSPVMPTPDPSAVQYAAACSSATCCRPFCTLREKVMTL